MEFGGRTQRRMPRRTLAASVITIIGAASLVACTTPTPTPTPSPSATTIFASEEEALAAATDTYQEYTAALDEVYAAGGMDSSSLEPLVTSEYWSVIREDRTLSDRGWRTVGLSSFDTVAVIDADLGARQTDLVTTLCRDVTQVRIVDSAGLDVTPAARRDRYPLTVTFQSAPDDGSNLLVAESDPWTGADPC